MYRHPLNPNLRLRPILSIHLHFLHLCQSRQSLFPKHMPKYSILPIQMRRLIQADEELTPIRARAFIRHTHYAPRIMSQRRSDLVFEWFRPDGISSFGSGRGCTSLDHEVGDEAVEGRGIVVACCAEGKEILRDIS